MAVLPVGAKAYPGSQQGGILFEDYLKKCFSSQHNIHTYFAFAKICVGRKLFVTIIISICYII